jgi:hypothetical protein
VSEGLVKQEFIDTRTEGYEDFKKELLRTDIAEMEKVTGVDRELVRKAAIAYASSPAAMSFHGLGVTEHYQGTFTVIARRHRDDDRQHRSPRRGREPAARTEQRRARPIPIPNKQAS